MKRALDLILLLVSLPFAIPLFAVTALLVRIKIGSPIFFTQPCVSGAVPR